MSTNPSEQPAQIPLVARFSAGFVKNYRITALLFVSILALGYLSYTRFLKVEGFPAVEVPVVFVEATYFVNDADRVDRELTTPIEKAAGELSEVTRVTSTATPVGTFVVAEFDEDLSSEKGAELLQKSVERSVLVPEGATINYRTINAGAMDGEHDIIFNISGTAAASDMSATALAVAKAVERSDLVARAEYLPNAELQTNPFTGQTQEVAKRFNRVGYRSSGHMVFENAAAIGVVRKPDVGIVELSDAIKAEVKTLQDSGDLDGYTITYGGDVSGQVLDQRADLATNAWSGLIMVVILTILIIDWRAAIVAGIFIPLVFAAVLVALYMIGYSLNIISLFSLVLVLGMFVDNATVVVDAIEREKARGLRGSAAIRAAMGSIGNAIIAGTWTNALVFVPMLFISGVLGKFIILIPVTVIMAQALSLFLALSVVPWLGNLFIRDRHSGELRRPRSHILAALRRLGHTIERPLNAITGFVTQLSLTISRFVYRYIGRRSGVAVVILVTLGLVGFGASYAGRLDFSVFPPAKDTDQIVTNLRFDEGTSVAEAEQLAKHYESILAEQLGSDLRAATYFVADDQQALLIADLAPMEERERNATDLAALVQDEVANFNGARVTVTAATVGPPVDDFSITVRVLSDDPVVLKRGTEAVRAFLADRELTEGERVTEVVVDRFDLLTKLDGERYAQVRAKVSDAQKTNVILDLQTAIEEEFTDDRLDDLGLHDDAVVVDLGQEGENVESFESAALALVIALIVMYGLLVAQFNSFSQPILIFLAIPLSFPLLFPALFYTGNALSFFVMLGILALAGIVVNNTIMLIDQANVLRRSGRTAREAISLSVSIRFRALLATSVSTIIGLIPLAVSDPFWEPLSYTIIFGLASSVVLVIVAFPAFYIVAEGLRSRIKRLFSRS